jgi:CTP:molybdopterin cytidylyltransferase MocA
MVSALLICTDQSSPQQTPTALQMMNSQTFVRTAINEILKAGVDEIIVVLSMKEIETEIRKYFDSLVRSSMIKLVYSHDKKMLRLVSSGLTGIHKDASLFLISRIEDCQLVAQDYILLIKQLFLSEQKIICYRFKNKISYPILLSKFLSFDLRQASQLQTLQHHEPHEYLINKYPDWVSWCELALATGTARSEKYNFDDIKLLLAKVS